MKKQSKTWRRSRRKPQRAQTIIGGVNRVRFEEKESPTPPANDTSRPIPDNANRQAANRTPMSDVNGCHDEHELTAESVPSQIAIASAGAEQHQSPNSATRPGQFSIVPHVPDAADLDNLVAQMVAMIREGLTASQIENICATIAQIIARGGATALMHAQYLKQMNQRLAAYHYARIDNRTWHDITKTALATIQHEQTAVLENSPSQEKPPRFCVKPVQVGEGATLIWPTLRDSTAAGTTSDNRVTEGIFDNDTGEFLTNFIIYIDKETEVSDEYGIRPSQRFDGTLRIFGADRPFSITSKQFASDAELKK